MQRLAYNQITTHFQLYAHFRNTRLGEEFSFRFHVTPASIISLKELDLEGETHLSFTVAPFM